VGTAFYRLPAGPRLREPADLAIPATSDESRSDAESGTLPNEPLDESMPAAYMDSRPWYPARPVTAEMTDSNGDILPEPDNYRVRHRKV
jgi:hypothetical protein